jgi:hypothetical protein
MDDAKAENNKAIVLEAFDTLFNKRDYTAAKRFWSPNYLQHGAHIEPRRDGLFNLISSIVKIRVDGSRQSFFFTVPYLSSFSPSLRSVPSGATWATLLLSLGSVRSGSY